jgi:hypothetical protein
MANSLPKYASLYTSALAPLLERYKLHVEANFEETRISYFRGFQAMGKLNLATCTAPYLPHAEGAGVDSQGVRELVSVGQRGVHDHHAAEQRGLGGGQQHRRRWIGAPRDD